MEFLINLFSSLEEITKGNQWASAGISVTLLSMALFMARWVPSKLWIVMQTQTTTSIVLHNTGYWGNRELFLSFMEWYWDSPYSKFSRRLSLDSRDHSSNSVTVGPGYGIHWFLFKGRLCWFTKTQLDSSGAETIKESIEIVTFGRSSKVLYQLVETFRPQVQESDSIDVYRFQQDGWARAAQVKLRPLDTVILPPELKRQITSELDSFFSDRDWYLAKNIPHKITLLLHGIPGTGKTSIIKALASHYQVPLYVLNIAEHSDRTFTVAMETVPRMSFVLIEDFDSAGAVKSRFPSKSPLEANESDLPPAPMAAPTIRVDMGSDDLLKSMLGLTLSGVLNTLDGPVPLDSVAVFLTTNDLGSIDPAVLRRGRVDCLLEFGPLSDPEIREFVRISYGIEAPHHLYSALPGCVLHDMLRRHRKNSQAFMEELGMHDIPTQPAVSSEALA